MAFQQLDPPLPVHVIDKGPGYAFAVIDYGQEHNLIWVTALDANGEIWCAPNPRVRMQGNWTMGRARPAVDADGKNCAGPAIMAEPVVSNG
ncbi:hypothetical protein [Sphingomonas sp. AX6]|jgi:hypothetical protein|uniref:hypothetical protein n=1 Tax=Sphingomonas sp. AX6 TaxID=2653171 RepID=UPI0012F22D95|nr:hypothetical protein [Sphingomonas sp. AX6]VXC89478.1 conserved hypothetical protein [Sphingomonas sp. AX6]